MSFLRTSLRLPRFRTRLPMFRARESVAGMNVGAQVAGQSLAQQARDSLDLEDLLQRARETPAAASSDAPSEAAPAGSAARDAATRAAGGLVPPRSRRRGPATLLERRDRLDDAVRRLAHPGAHIEYQANTIAVINQGNIFLRILRFLVGLPLIPIRWTLHAIEWVFRPRGAGRLKRTVVFVDRRGNVVVYRM